MAEEKYPSEAADRFQIRLPDGLRDEIRTSAAANGRSMNAEIVSRLSGNVESLRDRFAGHALAGILAGGFAGTIPHDDVNGGYDAAFFAYQYADAMVAVRGGITVDHIREVREGKANG